MAPLLAGVVALVTLALALCCAPYATQRACAEPATYGDGTIKGDATGPELMGFSVDRESTDSAKRGNADPNGPTFGISPDEVGILGTNYLNASNSPFGSYKQLQLGSADLNATMNSIQLPAGGSGSYPIADQMFLNSPGKVLAIDYNGDGVDENVAYYYDKDCYMFEDSSRPDGVLRAVVFDPRTPNEQPHEVFRAGGDLLGTMWDIRENLPSQAWSSVFPLTVGDFDGDHNEDFALLHWDYENEQYGGSWYKASLELYLSRPQADGSVEFEHRYPSRYVYYDDLQHGVPDQPYFPVSLVAGDLNNDGRDELFLSMMKEDRDYRGMYVRTAMLDGDDRVNVTSYQLNGVNLNGNSMLSLSTGDIDNDGSKELVLGGYSEGELFLGYLEWDGGANALNPKVQGFTRLRDDEGTAATTGADIDGQHPADTHQWSGDRDSDYMPHDYSKSRAMYPGATNWTVPLQTVSLSGFKSDTTCDQVYFGMWFYELDRASGQFRPYLDTQNCRYDNNDNNNVSVLGMFPIITDADVDASTVDGLSVYDGGQSLLLALSIDLDKDHGGDMSYQLYCYTRDGDHIVRSTREIDRADYYSKDFYPKACAGNQDQDTLLLTLEEHQFVYAEPVVVGVVMAPPYFEDIASETGYNSGSTEYTQTSGDEEAETGSCSLELDWSFAVGTKRAKVGPSFGGLYTGEWTHTTTHEYWYTLGTSNRQDSVALTCVPTDVYLYSTQRYDSAEGKYVPAEPLIMSFPCEPVTQMIALDDPASDDDYTARVKKYNGFVEQHNRDKQNIHVGNLLKYLPEPEEFTRHEPGDPSSYLARVDDLQGEVLVGNHSMALDHSTSFGNTYQSSLVQLTEGDSSTFGGAFSGGVNLSNDGWFKESEVDISVQDGGSKMTSDYGGSIYTGTLNSISNDYADYYFSCTLYAGVKQPERLGALLDDKEDRYVIVDYTTSDVHCLPAQARNLRVDKASWNEVTLSCDLPWNVAGSWQASEYVLERYDVARDRWVEVGEGAGRWTRNAASLSTQHVTVTDEGLEPDMTYRYRVMAYRTGATGAAYDNPTPTLEATTCPAPTFQVSFDAGEHGNVWAYVTDANGARFSLSSPATVRQGESLDFSCVPNAGWRLEGWEVLGGGGEPLDEGQYEVTDILHLSIPSLASDVHVKPILSDTTKKVAMSAGEGGTVGGFYLRNGKVVALDTAAENPVQPNTLVMFKAQPQEGVQVERWYVREGSADEVPVDGSEGEDSIPWVVTDDVRVRVSFAVPEGVGNAVSGQLHAAGGDDIAPGEVGLGGEPPAVGIDYSYDGHWTNDPLAQAIIRVERPESVARLSYVHGGAHAVKPPEAVEQGLTVGGLPDGDFLLPAITFDFGGNRDVAEVRVMKDTVEPQLAVQAVGRATGTTDKSYVLALFAKTGASGVAKVEIAPGKDAANGFSDVTDAYRRGVEVSEGGWYTVRLTTGLGAVLVRNVEVPKAPDDDPDDDGPGGELPDGEGSGDDQGGSGADSGAGGSGGGSAGGSPLAPTGDAVPAAASAMLALGAFATLAYAACKRGRQG